MFLFSFSFLKLFACLAVSLLPLRQPSPQPFYVPVSQNIGCLHISFVKHSPHATSHQLLPLLEDSMQKFTASVELHYKPYSSQSEFQFHSRFICSIGFSLGQMMPRFLPPQRFQLFKHVISDLKNEEKQSSCQQQHLHQILHEAN